MRFTSLFLLSLITFGGASASDMFHINLEQDFTGSSLLTADDFMPNSIDTISSFEKSRANWFADMIDAVQPTSSYDAPADQVPYIMMAGYMDTDLSFKDGGTFQMLAYVTDDDSAVQNVEIYWEGMPTGVYLKDDGSQGDFGINDDLWGLQLEIAPETLPAGEYMFELRAEDTDGHLSDLWPYLTIHP